MVTKGYGLTVDDIDWSSPADLEPYLKAYQLKTKEKDSLMHLWFGSYALSAVSVAVEHCLAGHKANSKYIDSPIMRDVSENENSCKESREEIAAYEMKQRIKMLRKNGLPESPM